MTLESEAQVGEAPTVDPGDQELGEEVAAQDGDFEASTEEYEGAPEVDYRQELQNVHGQVSSLTQQISQLASVVKQNALNNQPKAPEPKGPSDEELRALWEQNPVAAMKIMTEEQVRSAVTEATREIGNTYKRESGQQHWDKKAEQDFPMLKTDVEFQQAVTGKIQELTGDGEYKNDSPKLLYRAAQLAKASLGSKFYKDSSNKTKVSAGTHGGVGAPRTAKKGVKAEISDDDPELKIYLAFGGSNVEQRKKDLAKERAAKRRAK